MPSGTIGSTVRVSAHTTSPAERLRSSYAAVRVSFTWLGVRKTLSTEQKAQAAEGFGAPAADRICSCVSCDETATPDTPASNTALLITVPSMLDIIRTRRLSASPDLGN